MIDTVYKIGILGLGEGRSILRACDRSARWEAAWICDLDEDLCRQRRAEHRVGRYTLSYEEMLADPDLDVVAIFTPDPMHSDHCIQALEAGKHVVCTKPLIDDLWKGRVLLDAVERSGKKLMVGTSSRFFETFIEQRTLFESGRLGSLLSVEAHYHGDKRKGSAGRWGKTTANNWIYTGLVHPTDLVYWYAGLPVEVFGYGQVSPAMEGRGFDLEDNFHFVLKGRDGTPMTVSGIYGAPEHNHDADGGVACVLRGTEGSVEARLNSYDIFTNLEGEDPKRSSKFDSHAYYHPWGGLSHHVGEFQNYLESFANNLDDGSNPVPDVRDGLKVVAILKAMEKSMKEGKPVKLEYLLEEYGLGALVERHLVG